MFSFSIKERLLNSIKHSRVHLLLQLIKESAIPLTLAILWTLFNFYETQPDKRSIHASVNVFGPAFFFISWLVAQWFRVKKQQGVEKGLSEIDQNIKDTLAKLDATATHLAGQITGGDSVCYFFGPTTEKDAWKDMIVVHSGTHPLYEVSARICDIDKFRKDPSEWGEDPTVELGNLVPNHARSTPINLALGQGEYRRFNIFFTARNGSFTQKLRCRRINNQWTFATRVIRGEKVFVEHIHEEFPQDNSIHSWAD